MSFQELALIRNAKQKLNSSIHTSLYLKFRGIYLKIIAELNERKRFNFKNYLF
jgi:hypothetical protein